MRGIFILAGPAIGIAYVQELAARLCRLCPDAPMRAVWQPLWSAQLGAHVAGADWPHVRPADWDDRILLPEPPPGWEGPGIQTHGLPIVRLGVDKTEYGPHPGDVLVTVGCEDRYGYASNRGLSLVYAGGSGPDDPVRAAKEVVAEVEHVLQALEEEGKCRT